MSQERADATLAQVSTWGINHIDTAASYGASEDRLQSWLAEHRSELFLGTKTGERTGDGARRGLERSLERMGVDYVDLIQLHNLVEPDEWETAFGSDGAVQALDTARAEGLVRHIGVTGHGLRIAGTHLRSLERFDFASVLLPINFVLLDHAEYRSEVEQLLSACDDRNVAVQTIKAIARRRWSDGDMRKFSWYEPLTDPAAIDRAVKFVLSHPQMFLNTTSDARLLATTIDAASGELTRPSDEALRADIAEQGITPLFDGLSLERI